VSGYISLPQYSKELLRFDDMVVDESPGGLRDRINLHYTTANAYVSGTLETWIDGRRLTILDYVEDPSKTSFDFIVDLSDPQRLQRPPGDTEEIRVSYIKQASSTEYCIKNL